MHILSQSSLKIHFIVIDQDLRYILIYTIDISDIILCIMMKERN